MDFKTIYSTISLCPICMKKLDADIIVEDNQAFMIKSCSEHGDFKTVIWKGSIPIESWIRKKERAYIQNPTTKIEKGCPFDCGLCEAHRQHTCTALIEVTGNCNLSCHYCFANSHGTKHQNPTLDQIKFQYESILRASGKCNIQLSGGEPTLRDDLPEIVKMGTELGFDFIQINTNGIRLANDEVYVNDLKNSGLSSVFLQFDGTKDDIYEALRGRALYDLKLQAIRNCQKANIGVVLVPTLVPGVNLDNIGEIIKLGIRYAPVVKGVHFQPVSYFGRVPEVPKDTDRITLPQVMDEIHKQTGGIIGIETMKPPGCENALCSFHGNYVINENGLMNITKRSSCCDDIEKAEEGAIKAKAFVARNWAYQKPKCCDGGHSDWDKILNTLQNNSFSISAMAFQDVWNVNLERIKDCCIHVSTLDGKLIPFCMYNITNAEGNSIYRTNNVN
ncbi:MAG: radical SAM protein [Firmicutes bacterium HGW-Firmicutes-7]|nr:MAG: radical SAM protein [Firmicutes bacterium HGW-Firmicutes-7]